MRTAAFLCILGLASLSSGQEVTLAIPQVGNLPAPMQMHGSGVIGERLYVFGGEDANGWKNEVLSAPVARDGKLGAWRPETPLPVRLAFLNNCVEVVGNRIYIVGGVVAERPDTPELETVRSQDIFWTAARADGTLEEWRRSPPFPGPRLGFVATSSTEKHLLVVGGSSRQEVSKAIYAADYSPTGEPVNWRAIGEMPQSLWHHGAAILNSRLYVWGGITSRTNASHITKDPAPINDAAWSAELKEGAALGPWRTELAMAQPTFAAAFSGFNDYVLSIGGRYVDKSPTNAIWYSRLDNGALSKWVMTRTDLAARVFHSMALDRTRGVVFVTGGQDKKVAGNTAVSRLTHVQAFQIPQPEGARLSAERVATQPSGAASVSASKGGFLPLAQALNVAAQQNKYVLTFFYSPQVPDCRRFWDTVIQSPQFQGLAQHYIFAAVDVSGADGPLGPRFGIYKVPALAVLTPTGIVRASTISARTLDDVARLLSSR